MPRTPRQDPRKPRHGYSALRTRVKVAGLQAIDSRTAGAQALLGWQKDLIHDLGGEHEVSAQERALIEQATRTRLFIGHIDAWVMESGLLIHRGKRALYPIVKERQALVDSLARLLVALGLQRRQIRTLIPNPDELMVEVKAEMVATGTNGASHDDEATHCVHSSDHSADTPDEEPDDSHA
jgi:hypothetical protein